MKDTPQQGQPWAKANALGAKFYKLFRGTIPYTSVKSLRAGHAPQDCEVMSDGQLAAMLSMPGMEQTLTNQFPDLGLNKSVQFDPFTSVFETLKKLVQLYFK